MPRTKCSSLYEVWDGGTKRNAVPKDSYWWKMYIEHPRLNIPKFHRCFRQRFRLPYAMFIQFVSDAKENNWFPRWSRWNSTCPIELLILGGFTWSEQAVCHPSRENPTLWTLVDFIIHFFSVISRIIINRNLSLSNQRPHPIQNMVIQVIIIPSDGSFPSTYADFSSDSAFFPFFRVF
jgi:hypothetical protein